MKEEAKEELKRKILERSDYFERRAWERDRVLGCRYLRGDKRHLEDLYTAVYELRYLNVFDRDEADEIGYKITEDINSIERAMEEEGCRLEVQ